MNQQQLDELYHLLRLASNELGIVGRVVLGLAHHLSDVEGDYSRLLAFSSYYGNKYLVSPVCKIIKDSYGGLEFNRVVELGAGNGWLAEGICRVVWGEPTISNCLLVDKRQWRTSKTMLLDLETSDGVSDLLEELRPTDLVVSCDFLHCIDNPASLIGDLETYNMVMLEYIPVNIHHRKSYREQLTRYGAKPFETRADFMALFDPWQTELCTLEPYAVAMVKGVERGERV